LEDKNVIKEYANHHATPDEQQQEETQVQDREEEDKGRGNEQQQDTESEHAEREEEELEDKEDKKNMKCYNLRKRKGKTVYVSASTIFCSTISGRQMMSLKQ
jgi:hypothetical protein